MCGTVSWPVLNTGGSSETLRWWWFGTLHWWWLELNTGGGSELYTGGWNLTLVAARNSTGGGSELDTGGSSECTIIAQLFPDDLKNIPIPRCCDDKLHFIKSRNLYICKWAFDNRPKWCKKEYEYKMRHGWSMGCVWRDGKFEFQEQFVLRMFRPPEILHNTRPPFYGHSSWKNSSRPTWVCKVGSACEVQFKYMGQKACK